MENRPSFRKGVVSSSVSNHHADIEEHDKTSSGDGSELSKQYGGTHTAGWVDMLPKSWVPYIQLARLSPAVGPCLVFFPHVFGFLHGAFLVTPTSSITSTSSTLPSSSAYLGPSAMRLIQPASLLVVGTFFLSNAIHGWNDLVDAPYDALVERTRGRPVVRGAISKTAAFIFTVSQGVLGALLLVLMLPDLESSVRVAWPGVVANLYYPFAKRHTYFAQYVLAVSLAWGVVVSTAGVLVASQPEGGYDDIWTSTSKKSTAALTVAAGLWTVIYDTIYAFQDRQDDIRVGLKSTAVLFGEWTKVFLTVNLAVIVGSLVFFGHVLELGLSFSCFGIGGAFFSLGAMIYIVDLADPTSCWWWFRHGFWLAGGSIATGLLVECLQKLD